MKKEAQGYAVWVQSGLVDTHPPVSTSQGGQPQQDSFIELGGVIRKGQRRRDGGGGRGGGKGRREKGRGGEEGRGDRGKERGGERGRVVSSCCEPVVVLPDKVGL